MSHDVDWETKQIEDVLAGAIIVGPVSDAEGEYFGFRVHLPTIHPSKRVKGTEPMYQPHETVVWVDRDQEGNGCGHLNIETYRAIIPEDSPVFTQEGA